MMFRVGRRHLHTIISREIIKPSSPTHSHLQTYNLSLLDHAISHIYMPMIFFYPNYNDCNATVHEKASDQLRKSLSQSLTQFYPFAGRFPTPSTPYVDCNDDGIVCLEARNDNKIDKFLHKEEQNETLNQLFPDGLVWSNSSHDEDGTKTIPLAVQLSHFSCGGVAVAVSMNHKIGDGRTLATFMNHWATVARCGSTNHKEVLPVNPHLISFQLNSTPIIQNAQSDIKKDLVIKKFVFPNSKLSELKNKVLYMDTTRDAPSAIKNNPTRVEVLTSLLYKCAVKAATTNLECVSSSRLNVVMNMRKKMIEKLPETTMGNIFSLLTIPSPNTSEITLNTVVAEWHRSKTQLGRTRNVQEAGEIFAAFLLDSEESRVTQSVSFAYNYLCTSICGFPFYEVDFGWGKPIQSTVALGAEHMDSFVLMDTPAGDGIEALVVLRKKEMHIFQKDEELLAFC